MVIIHQQKGLLPIENSFESEWVEKDEEKRKSICMCRYVKIILPSPHHSIHSDYDKSWEHLKLFHYHSFIPCSLPIYRHKNTSNFTKAGVNFARGHARFTIFYEQEGKLLMKLLPACLITKSLFIL